LHNWINGKTISDEFSPLHFASFNGNIDAIEALVMYGADIYALNKNKLNMLHVAAQNDQAISLYYFKLKKLDINAVDEQGNTPLHWSCYQRSEIALSYLLSWKPLVDK
jgi:ankyrin repeat protein